MAAPFAAALLLGACAASETQPGKVSDMFATPEWAKANQARATTKRAITQADLMNQDGSCALESAPVATDGVASPEANNALAESGQLPTFAGGVGLGMTECQVVQRTGYPDTFNISAEGSDRIATMTVTGGSWPGLYRFRGGRLVSIERIEVPAPTRSTRPARAKKTATTSQPMPLRGAQR